MTLGSPMTRAGAARRARAVAASAAALAATAALACGDDPSGVGGGAAPPTLCGSTVAVSVVGSGDLPTFTWSPACGVSDVVVTREVNGATAEVVWHVRFPELRPVGPSVRYSQLPPRGETVQEPRTLVRGATYRATVRSIVGGDVIVGGGSTTFVF